MEQVIPHGADSAGAGLSSSMTEWQQAGKWFSYDGHAIFSRMAGQGEPLVLLHGFPTASWDWNRLWPLLARHYQVPSSDVVSLRGVGHYPQVECPGDVYRAYRNFRKTC